jgi:hypothetical protein
MRSSAGVVAGYYPWVRRPLERAVVLALWITCIIVLPVLALVFYVVRLSKPGRFRLTAKVLRLLDITIEIDGQDGPKGPA